MQLAIAEKLKPLLVEMQTQTDPPEVDSSKSVTSTGSTEIVKVIGQTSSTSLIEFRPTNETELFMDSINKITDCNALAYKEFDDTIPILRMIAQKFNLDNLKDSLSQLETLSKYIN